MNIRIIKSLLVTITLTAHIITNAEESRMYGSGHLTSTLITCTEQDDMGYIWIGTEYGLNRYDGISFTGYYNNEENPGSLMSNSVRTLFNDNNGRLWIGLLTGMQMYDPQTDSFRTVEFPNISYIPNISHIMQLSSGDIWMIAARLGIYELNTEKMTAHRLNNITNLCRTDHLNHFLEDAHERLWLASENDGIFCFEKGYESFRQYFSDNREEPAIRLALNRTGIVTAAYAGRIWLFDEVNHQFVPLDQPSELFLDVRDMFLRENGEMLVATYNEGIWKVDEENKRIVRESSDPNPVCLMEDREGNLWCGYFHKGVQMSAPPQDRHRL